MNRMYLVEKENKDCILDENYNNKMKEGVRRNFKDKIQSQGMKKEEARDTLKAELKEDRKPRPGTVILVLFELTKNLTNRRTVVKQITNI